MPVPSEYQRLTDDFYRFLIDAREAAFFGSTHQAFTMTQGVFQAFRRRLEIRDAIRFANVLPPGLRALFVADWDPDEPKKPFQDLETMTVDVRALRPEHNFSPDDAISIVASVVRRNVDEAAFDRLLQSLPPGAVEFWQP